MDRYWLLTSAFYGNRLPGDPRGFVSRVRDVRAGDAPGTRHEHDIPGTPVDADMPGLHRSAQGQLKGPPIRVNPEQAGALVPQFRETAGLRGWLLLAVAVVEDHVHLVVGVRGDPHPRKVLGDFKAYGSRPLTRGWGTPPSGTWWTYGGSKRKLPNTRAVRSAIIYLRDQPGALLVWLAPQALAMLAEGGLPD
ncbi:MAG TPA: hypothetical protein VKD90_10885 [Gemmataceae bacterium]|nr:hypothetical protein [Gemmataceae bacterium]